MNERSEDLTERLRAMGVALNEATRNCVEAWRSFGEAMQRDANRSRRIGSLRIVDEPEEPSND